MLKSHVQKTQSTPDRLSLVGLSKVQGTEKNM